MQVQVRNDLITSILSGNAVGVFMPDDLVNIDLSLLRFDGVKIVLASKSNSFYIDKDGKKHIVKHGASWQSLACQFDDPVILDSNTGKWRKQTPADKKENDESIVSGRIYAHAMKIINAASGDYSSAEMADWARLEAEAKVFGSNGSVGELMNGLTHPGRGSIELAASIIDKANALRSVKNSASINRDIHLKALAIDNDPINYDWSGGW